MATVRTFDPTPQNLLEIHRAFRAIRIQLPQSTFDATVPPTTEDDITQGWKIGSLWVDTVTHTIYQCADNVIGEAVWLQMVPLKVVVGGGVAGGGIDPGAADDINQGFSVGSLWINSVDRTVFMCYDATASAAVWRRLSVTATDRLLGRQSAGAGDVEEITCTAAGRALLDDADAAAQRTTLGLGALAVLASPVRYRRWRSATAVADRRRSRRRLTP